MDKMRQLVDEYHRIENYAMRVVTENKVLTALCNDWSKLLEQHYANRLKNISLEELADSILKVSAPIDRDVVVPLRKKKNALVGEHSNLTIEILAKFSHENTHSDFIATLLDSEQTGDFAGHFFLALLNFGKTKTVPIKIPRYQYVYREHRLKDSQRRIDILAATEDAVLVIENKVESCELENQTRDYRKYIEENFIKNRYQYLFLTLNEATADDEKFINISYRELHDLLDNLHRPKKQDARRFLDFYLYFLQMTFRGNLIYTKE
ncbi:MAG: PD-(D/E)XK nuclease family protein [Oligoflexia bacterium]|nr:PD-(D/E)XK nuclease family protein [Oligoflexia bacterium]